jgi:glycosyltransferase involved in cell wall biosynthesis
VIDLGIVVSTYNNPSSLRKILGRILSGSTLPSHIHIADDGSGSETGDVIQRFQDTSIVPLFHHWHEDLGFRKCLILNKTLATCSNDYILFLDGDCLPHQHFVKDHLNLAEKGFFLQGRRCFVSEDSVTSLLTGDISLFTLLFRGKLSGVLKAIRWPSPIIFKNRNQRGLIGCNWSVWRDDLVAVNGFDEEYEGWGIGEDSDICSRLYNHGLSRKFVYGRALVFHLNHPQLNKTHLPGSLRRLQQVVESGKVRCNRGLDGHTAVSNSLT